jgi:multidrug efflux system membrane fusion protein
MNVTDKPLTPELLRKMNAYGREIDTDIKGVPTVGRTRSRVLRVLIWSALLLLVGVALYLFFGRKEETKVRPAAPITITTVTAQKGNIGVYLDAIGTVTPVYTASIFSQVTGVVFAVKYQEGQLVKKGDALTDIDDRPFVATLLQAQGALQRDQNLLAQAKMDLEHYRAERDAVAKQILDDQEKLVLQDDGTVKNDQGIVQYD